MPNLEVAGGVIALSMGESRRIGELLQTDFAGELPHVSVRLQQVILNLCRMPPTRRPAPPKPLKHRTSVSIDARVSIDTLGLGDTRIRFRCEVLGLSGSGQCKYNIGSSVRGLIHSDAVAPGKNRH
jgi:hypothetical protein